MNVSRDGHTTSNASIGENDLLFVGFNQDSGKKQQSEIIFKQLKQTLQLLYRLY